MSNITSESQKLRLDEEDKKKLLSEELKTPLEELSTELEGYNLNSERKEAWISEIIPPEESNSNKYITVEFLLPSTDTFQEQYEYPDKRLPDNHPFKKLLEETGNTPSTLKMALGEAVDITYDEDLSRWTTEVKYKQKQDNKSNQKHTSTKSEKYANIDLVDFATYLMIVLLVGLIAIMLAIVTRGVGLIAILFVVVSLYLIKSA